MKLTKIISTLAVLAFANVAAAEQDGFKISGDFATSIFSNEGRGRNFAHPVSGARGLSQNDGAFSIDLAELNIEKTVGNSSIVMGIGYGRMFDTINYTIGTGGTAPKSTLNLTNAYFAHKLGDTGLSFRIGKFESFMGHENYNYMDNMNYTRGYAFSYMMPFYFTGLNVNYTVNDMFDIGLYAVNTSANLDTDDNRTKSYGAAVNIKPMEGLGIRLNYLTGNEGSNVSVGQVETQTMNGIVSYNMNNMDFTVQYVAKSQDSRSSGGGSADSDVIGLYAGYKADVWGAGLRYEIANYDAGSTMDVGTGSVITTADNTINAATLSGWYDVDQNARIKVDIAQISSDEKVFADKDGAAEDATMSYGLGFMYRF